MSAGHFPSRTGRFVVLFVIVGLVVAAIIAAEPSPRRRPVQLAEQVDTLQIGAESFAAPNHAARDRATPIASRPDAASTTWFCGGGPANATQLIVTNTAPAPRLVTITAVDAKGSVHTRSESVPAYRAQSVSTAFAGRGPLAATVESRHGGIVVTQRIIVDDAATLSACATASSSSWYFAGGDTERGASEEFVLFNPFDDLATADVTFLTPNGFRNPQATQGLAVPGQSAVVVSANDVQNRRSGLGSAVTTRAGRLIVWRVQNFDGSGPDLAGGSPPKGFSVTLGQAIPLARFALTTGVAGSGVTPQIILANPGATDTRVRLSFAVDDPGTNGTPSPTTIDLVSGAVKVLTGESLRQVPPGVPFSVTGQVLGGGAVVAELWLDGTEPAKGHGSYAVTATAVGGTDWVVPVGLGSPPLDELGLQSSGAVATVGLWTLRNGAMVPLHDAGLPVKVPASGRVTLDLAAILGTHRGDTVLVRSNAPVSVSRLQAGAGSHGLVSAPGVPLAGTLVDP